MKRILLTALTLLILVVSALPAFSFEPFVETEQGAIAILYHTYKNGASANDGATNFDFRNEGGQDIIFPFERYAVGATIAGRHRAWFTYQPLELVTNVTFRENVTVGAESDGSTAQTFAAGTPMELTYSFPFYRFTYTYDVLGKHDNAVLGLGLVLQIRDASVKFLALNRDTTTDEGLYVSQNVGLVPALAIYSEYRFPFGLNLSADIAGSYASSSFFKRRRLRLRGFNPRCLPAHGI